MGNCFRNFINILKLYTTGLRPVFILCNGNTAEDMRQPGLKATFHEWTQLPQPSKVARGEMLRELDTRNPKRTFFNF